jgi:hypothetical protein
VGLSLSFLRLFFFFFFSFFFTPSDNASRVSESGVNEEIFLLSETERVRAWSGAGM